MGGVVNGDAPSTKERVYTKLEIAAAFNRWMDDFSNNPEGFQESNEVVKEYLSQKSVGDGLSYGQDAAETLIEYLNKND